MSKNTVNDTHQLDDSDKIGGGVKRIRWIDEVRGLAIVLVIIGHVIGGLSSEMGGGEENILRTAIYGFHMPLMFIVSGLVAHKNEYKGMKDFLSKILRLLLALYIPYLLWGYLFWATKYFVYAGNKGVTLYQGSVLFWNSAGFGPGWYLLTLLFIKMMELFIDSFVKNAKIRILLWCVLFLLGGYINNIYLVSTVLQNGIYYEIGKTIKIARFQENKIYNPANCFMLLCIVSVCRFSGHLNYVMDFCIAFSVSGLIILIFSLSNCHSKILETMGKGSMVPYVLHAYMTIPVRVILQKCGCHDFAVYVIAETVVAILLSLIIIKIMERFKWIKAFFYPTAILKRR